MAPAEKKGAKDVPPFLGEAAQAVFHLIRTEEVPVPCVWAQITGSITCYTQPGAGDAALH